MIGNTILWLLLGVFVGAFSQFIMSNKTSWLLLVALSSLILYISFGVL